MGDHGRQETGKEPFLFFVLKNRKGWWKKNGKIEVAGQMLQQMRGPAQQLGRPAVKGPCVQVPML